MTERLMESEKMPDEIWAYKQPYQKTSGTWSLSAAKKTFKSRKPIGERTRYIRADLCATAGDAKEALNKLDMAQHGDDPMAVCLQVGEWATENLDLIRKLLGGNNGRN